MNQNIYATKELLTSKLDEIFNKMPQHESNSMICISKYLRHENKTYASIANSLALLSKLCSAVLDNKSKNDPFKPLIDLGNSRSFIPSDLTVDEINYLSKIVQHIKPPALKARIADVLWNYTSPRNVNDVRTAIESYILIDICQELFQPDIYDFWHRAVFLAKQTKQNNLIDLVKNKLENELINPSTDWAFHKLNIAEILVATELDKTLYSKIADELNKEKSKFNSTESFNELEQYLTFLISLYKKLNHSDKEQECRYALALAFEQHGDFKTKESNMVANHFYHQSLNIYREIPNTYKEKLGVDIGKIEQKITQSNLKIPDELQLLSTKPFDISPLQNQSIQHVQDKSTLLEALLYFSGVSSIVNYGACIKQAEQNVQSSIISHIGGFQAISLDGRKIDKIPVINENNQDEVILKTAIKNHPIKMQLSVQGCIMPALQKIQEQHIIPKDFLIQLCKHSNIVPDKRENLVAKALYFGFEGEFDVSIHLLAPQVENMVRQLLKNKGISTTNIDKGIEHENGLSSLIDDAREILGDDMWFELKAVFTSSLSSNLRNEVGHGLLDDETSNSLYSAYAWWLILRWIIRNPA